MHYILENGVVIKTENAALSTKQTNKVILEYISRLPQTCNALDYGCGKLRHSIPLYKKVMKLVVIDSDQQIERIQVINGNKTSIKAYINQYMPLAEAYPLSSFIFQEQSFDFIMCTNVLSAIPDYSVRMKALDNIKIMLKLGGTALISDQFRNSYFKTYNHNPSATKYLDGWIIKKKDQTYSFYGIIGKEKLVSMCQSVGLSIKKITLVDGSVYAEVMRADI